MRQWAGHASLPCMHQHSEASSEQYEQLRQELAVHREEREMEREERQLEHKLEDFERSEERAKRQIEDEWRREHWGHDPERPPAWRTASPKTTRPGPSECLP